MSMFLPDDRLRDLKVETLAIGRLTPYDRNPRTHSKKQIRQIARSIESFGFTNPVLIDEAGSVLAGHGRLEAAKLLGMKAVPTVCLDQMSEAEKRAYIIADNRLAEKAGWDEDLLRLELSFLTDLDIDLDVTVTGFETPEIDLLLEEDEDGTWDEADTLPVLDPEEPAVSRVGDVWVLGAHRLACGDATNPEAFSSLMSGEQAALAFCDPPYNLEIGGFVSGLGATQHREFPMASGEMSKEAFTGFLVTVLGHMAAHSQNGALHFICMDWRHMGELLAAGEQVYTELKNLCVWDKGQGGMGSLYRSRHELVFLFKHGTAPHLNQVELGRHGRNRTNVWRYPGANRRRPGGQSPLALHPTVKPVAMIADALRDSSERGGIVLDGFGGSGSTLMAAERTGRRARLLELDRLYVDLTIKRYRRLTGNEVVHEASGLSFERMKDNRPHHQTREDHGNG